MRRPYAYALWSFRVSHCFSTATTEVPEPRTFFFLPARHTGTCPYFCFVDCANLILGSVKFLKTFSYKYSLQGVDTASNTFRHVLVRVFVMVIFEPTQVRVGDVNHLWHDISLSHSCLCCKCISNATKNQHPKVSKVLTFPSKKLKSSRDVRPRQARECLPRS